MEQIINQYRQSYESRYFQWLKDNDRDNPMDGFNQMQFDQDAAPVTTNRSQLVSLGILAPGENITKDTLTNVITALNQIGVVIETNDSSTDRVVSVLNKAIDDEIPASWGYNQSLDVIEIFGE